MKILLDECLPLDFRHSFPAHDAHSAEWAAFKGKANGELLREAELAGPGACSLIAPDALHATTTAPSIGGSWPMTSSNYCARG